MKKLSKPAISAQERKWEIEDAMRTLQRAEDIKKNKRLMDGVKDSVLNLQKMAFGGPVKKSSSISKKK
jgi:hypothetical protein